MFPLVKAGGPCINGNTGRVRLSVVRLYYITCISLTCRAARVLYLALTLRIVTEIQQVLYKR